MQTTIALDELLNNTAADDDVFERPLGPHAHCFSASQVVRMFESGALPSELTHMFECEPCRDVVGRSSRLAKMLGGEEARTRSSGSGRVAQESTSGGSLLAAAAVLGIPEAVVEVEHLERPLSVIVELLTGTDNESDTVDAGSLRLAGAATSVSATLEPSKLAPGRLHRVIFRNAALSRTVKEVLANHRSVADEIRVSGLLNGTPQRHFSGKARVEFSQALRGTRQGV